MYFDSNRHIDEYFRNHLKDYSQVPDDNVWKSIEAKLSYESKMRRFFVFKTAAIGLLVLGLAVFLAMEVSNYSPAGNHLTSAWEKELSLTDNRIEPNSSYIDGGNSNQDNLFSLKTDKSDVSVPENLLYKEQIKHSEPSLEKEKLAKLTSLREPMMDLENNENSSDNLRRSSLNGFYFSERNFGQFQDIAFNQKNKKKNKFSLSGSFSPVLSYRHSKLKNIDNNRPAENSLLSYSGGIDFSYNLADKLAFRTGMHYTKFGQSLNNVKVTSGSYAMKGGNTVIKIASSMGKAQVQYEELMKAQQFDESPSYITYDNNRPPEFNLESAIYQTFEMVKMPFLLEYTFLDDKFNFSMIGGINANLLVNEGIYMEQAQNTRHIGSTKNLRSVSYSGTLGLGLQYDINSTAQLFMEPSFDYYITSLNSDNSYQTFPYFFGFFSGVSISF
jgi:hypothetical protein